MLKIFGDEVTLRARVEVLNGYSAHADRGELVRWLSAVRGPNKPTLPVYLVHGEPDAQNALRDRLVQDGYGVTIPSRNSTYPF